MDSISIYRHAIYSILKNIDNLVSGNSVFCDIRTKVNAQLVGIFTCYKVAAEVA